MRKHHPARLDVSDRMWHGIHSLSLLAKLLSFLFLWLSFNLPSVSSLTYCLLSFQVSSCIFGLLDMVINTYVSILAWIKCKSNCLNFALYLLFATHLWYLQLQSMSSGEYEVVSEMATAQVKLDSDTADVKTCQL
jgi:hypothetical protein